MNALYALVGISKQAHLAFQQRRPLEQDKWLLLEPVLTEWRGRHPCMGLKKLYTCIQPDFIGRDKFIDFAMANGWEAVRYAKQAKTTIPICTRKFPNLLVGLLITDINQVWVTDITYLKLFGRWSYLVLIMDLYSRRIIGHHASNSLHVQGNLNALKMALGQRGTGQFKDRLVHHSDRGSQYNALNYLEQLSKAGIRVSMGRIVYDNIHSERAHQTIKSEYLVHRNIARPGHLSRHLNQVVHLYNHERPHLALDMNTPIEFERYLSNIPLCQRTPMRVFALNTKQERNSVEVLDHAQLELPFV